MAKLALIVTSVAVIGCFDLPAIPTNTCGNGILEPGEDCDTFPDPSLGSGLTCSASCRYACTPGDPATCPAGWGCGIDSICRHGTGDFTAGSSVLMPAVTLTAAPLDGDGRIQAIGAGGGTLEVLHDETLATSSLRVGGATLVATADPGSGAASLLVSDATAVVGWNTAPTGGFQPILAISRVPPALATPSGVQFLPMLTDVSTEHDVAFVLLQPPGATDPAQLQLTTQFALAAALAPAPYAVPQPQGALGNLVSPAIGNITGGPGDELALGFSGSNQIAILATNAQPQTQCGMVGCWSAIDGDGEIDAPNVLSTVALGPAMLADPDSALVFGDVDNDNNIDLVIPVKNGVLVALGDGNGGFTVDISDTPLFSLDPGTDRALCSAPPAQWGKLVSNPPLLAADLGNGFTDYVDTEGIVLGGSGGTYCRATLSNAATSAVVLDANGDGRPDVAVIDGGFVYLDTQSPNPYEFDAHLIAIPDGAIATRVETAEVDGDYLADIVIHATGVNGVSEVWIAHGTTDPTNVDVTAGPDLSTAQTFAAGSYQRDTGSTGGLVVYGHDALTGTDYTAALGTTPGGLGSELDFLTAGSLALAFDVQVGNFLCAHTAANGPACPPNTLDLVVLRGKTSSALTIDVWPNQGGVLRDDGHVTGTLSLASAYAGVRTYGDVDGDGIDELCVVVDGTSGSTFTCNDVTLANGSAGTTPSSAPPFTIAGFHAPVAAQLADVDGDGKTDLVVAFAGTGGSGGGVVVVYAIGSAPDVTTVTTTPASGVLAVNVNADPALEIVAISDAIHIYHLAATGPVEIGAIDGASGPYTGAITASDLDGDGVPDLIVGQSASSVLVLWPATNTGPAR